MLRDEAKAIRENFRNVVLTALLLQMGGNWIVGEADNVSKEAITSWMKRLQELTAGYSSEKFGTWTSLVDLLK